MVLGREHRPADRDVWLDAVVVAGATATLASAALLAPVMAVNGGSLTPDGVSVAYPIADGLLLGMVVWGFAVSRWHPSRALLLLGAVLALVAVADLLFAYHDALGAHEVGSWLDVWPAATLALAAAAWAPNAARGWSASGSRRALAIPVGCAVVAVGVLIYGNLAGIGGLALGLAAATTVLVLVRAERSTRRLATETMLEERRRIARDLHDGLAQELAFIGRNAALLRDQGVTTGLPERIQASVERASVESRLTIAALSEAPDVSFELWLGRAARDVARRHGVDLDLDLSPGVTVSPAQRVEVARICCEAIANAARHSGADRIGVVLERHAPSLRLRITDGGCGFDPATVTGSGFGLVGMRERAQALGAALDVRSSEQTGTCVELVL